MLNYVMFDIIKQFLYKAFYEKNFTITSNKKQLMNIVIVMNIAMNQNRLSNVAPYTGCRY